MNENAKPDSAAGVEPVDTGDAGFSVIGGRGYLAGREALREAQAILEGSNKWEAQEASKLISKALDCFTPGQG